MRDATSVYGYAGPVFPDSTALQELGKGFRDSLEFALKEERVVTVFSRLHPLLTSSKVLDSLGECRLIGRTVSIDLSLPTEKRRRHYRSNHRRDIRRLITLGVTCAPDPDLTFLPEFERIYEETMERAGAHESYFFDSRYFKQLFELGSTPPMLIVCLFNDRVVCAGIFLREGKTVQYHLSGTAADFEGRASLKLLIDYAADWFHSQGGVTLHLGGGVGGQKDGLLHFKQGFSNSMHEFWAWRWVVEPDTYAELPGVSAAKDDYFPKYRQFV